MRWHLHDDLLRSVGRALADQRTHHHTEAEHSQDRYRGGPRGPKPRVEGTCGRMIVTRFVRGLSAAGLVRHGLANEAKSITERATSLSDPGDCLRDVGGQRAAASPTFKAVTLVVG